MKTAAKRYLLLGATLVFAASGLLFARAGTERVPSADYELKMSAARLMQANTLVIKEYKQQNGIPIHPLDIHATGLLGADFNEITTTLGEPGAKRTSAHPDMAALVVDMLREAGVKPGDRVGVNLSGSFPGMNLAALSALEVYGAEVVCVVSVGSSTYGGNNPEFSFPEMFLLLESRDLLHPAALEVTPGGGGDAGGGMNPEMLQEITGRITRAGGKIYVPQSYEDAVEHRREFYGDIKCFISVGGNMTSLGRDKEIPLRGLIKPGEKLPAPDANSGLVETYHADKIPVIHLLNLKRLTEDYGLPFDPTVAPEPGLTDIYFEVRTPKLIPGVCLAGALVSLVLFKKSRDREKI